MRFVVNIIFDCSIAALWISPPKSKNSIAKSKLAQEAHEAIRPTDPSKLPADIKDEKLMEKINDFLGNPIEVSLNELNPITNILNEANLESKKLIKDTWRLGQGENTQNGPYRDKEENYWSKEAHK